jgi:hypothetical protein
MPVPSQKKAAQALEEASTVTRVQVTQTAELLQVPSYGNFPVTECTVDALTAFVKHVACQRQFVT